MASNSAGIGGLLPPQTTDVASYILTTDGQTASWEASSASLPSQGGNSGKYLTTNGTVASWAAVSALPDQTGNNGKVLGTNGTVASWVDASGLALGAVGAAPNDDGATLSGGTLNLEPASSTKPGVVTAGAQTFGGDKTIGSILLTATGGAFGASAVAWADGTYVADLGTVMLVNAAEIRFLIANVVACTVKAAELDCTGFGNGGSIKLKSPDGTSYTASIANGGTWSIV